MENILYKNGRAWIEISQKNLYHNIKVLQNLLPSGCQLMLAIKANAYGHGAVIIAKELNGCGIKSFCVATVSEGKELRENGIKGEILVLGYTEPNEIPLLQKYCITQTVLDYSYAKLLDSFGIKIKVHLKIDTGMHRLGVWCENIDEILCIYDCRNLLIEGMYTHLCAADDTTPNGKKYTSLQGKRFFEVLEQIKKHGYSCPKIHIQSSYGVLNYPNLIGDYVRIGIALYGVLSKRSDMQQAFIDLNPILTLKARIVLVKKILKGEPVGYGLQYTAEEDKEIAVLSIGYADGVPRSLSFGHSSVIINGELAPTLGSICMDQMQVDITGIANVKQGDIAVIIGRSGENEVSVYDMAEKDGTITNEILSRLGGRLERVLI